MVGGGGQVPSLPCLPHLRSPPLLPADVYQHSAGEQDPLECVKGGVESFMHSPAIGCVDEAGGLSSWGGCGVMCPAPPSSVYPGQE